MDGAAVKDPRARARRLGLRLAFVVVFLLTAPIVWKLWLEWSRPAAR